MGGMGGGGLNPNDPAVVAAFHRALLRGGLVVAVLLAALFVVWRICRARQLLRGPGAPTPAPAPAPAPESGAPAEEAPGRRLVRVGFGLLWIFDGLLQGQASMPLGMVPQVVRPAAATSPGWVQHMVQSVSTVWTYHPATAAASAVWVQVGLGLLLLVSGSTEWSRLAGLAGAAWGLIVWVFGEAFGSLLGTGVTWLFGAPGAALLYVAAGVVVALPLSVWRTGRTGRWGLRVLGAFFVGMAVLQAWPGRGFWQGGLADMVRRMAHTPQPGAISSLVRGFAGLATDHGWGVNLFAVVALAVTGLLLLSPSPRLIRVGVVAAVVLCLADWVLVQDLGFLGGVGTDPNSMVPLAVLIAGGYLALVRVPAPVPAAVGPGSVGALPLRARLRADPAYTLRASAALAALGVTLVGVAPMTVAAAQAPGRHAAPAHAAPADHAAPAHAAPAPAHAAPAPAPAHADPGRPSGRPAPA